MPKYLLEAYRPQVFDLTHPDVAFYKDCYNSDSVNASYKTKGALQFYLLNDFKEGLMLARVYDSKDGINYGGGYDVKPNDRKYCFYDHYGNIVFKCEGLAESFSNGLAAVSKKDEFGEHKWGFIDATGKVIIDYTYSKKPENFHSGLAVVYPKDNSEFDYGYINKKGELIIKVKNQFGKLEYFTNNFNDSPDSSNAFTFYKSGSNGLGADILFKSGTKTDIVSKLEEKLKQFNSFFYPALSSYSKVKIDKGNCFSYSANVYESDGLNTKVKVGNIDVGNGSILLPVFDEIREFSEKWGLAYAKRKVDSKVIEGYINKFGYFVITKAETSKW